MNGMFHAYYCVLFSNIVGLRARIRLVIKTIKKINMWLVGGYAPVIVLVSVVAERQRRR